MNKDDLFRAFDDVDDTILERSETIASYRTKKSGWLKWGTLAACVGLLLTTALAALPGILTGKGDIALPVAPEVHGSVISSNPSSDTEPSAPAESDFAQVRDDRAESWATAEELGMAASGQTAVGGLAVPAFLSYQGGLYGAVDTNQMDSLRFALSESDSLLFNTHYTRKVYLVEGHPDWIAIPVNGMEVYQKIFEVIFEVNGAAYAIAYSPIMNADYSLGDLVLETEDYTVYEAVKLQEESARTTEYIVDILPLLQRERPNLFDGSDLDPDSDYAEQWQLALPLEGTSAPTPQGM